MIMTIIGAIAPFIPTLFDFGKQWLDHKQEKEMLELRLKHAAQEHEWRMDAIAMEADVKFMQAARKPHRSFGIQLLDKAEAAEGVVWKWSFNILLLLFGWIDIVISSVRPTVTFALVGFYIAIKWAMISTLTDVTGSLQVALVHEGVWTATDVDMLAGIMFFWFGNRFMEKRSRAGK